MIVLPWIVFFLAVGWMIQRGFSEKRKAKPKKAEK